MTDQDRDILDMLLRTPLDSAEQAEGWVRDMHAIGYGTHPDDSGASVVKAADGSRLFTDEQADLYDARMGEAFDLLPDVYQTALDALS